jgi:hypothetical protein
VLEPAQDERLRADEDVEAVEEVRLQLLPRLVRDLQAAQVGRGFPQPLDQRDRDGVARSRLELVDVERERRARRRRGLEVAPERALVEREVRRRDHGNGRGAGLGRMRRERGRVGGRLGAAVGGDGQPAWSSRGEEELGHPPPLLAREQDPLSRRPAGEDPVDAPRGEKFDVRLECRLVERRAAGGQRRQRRSEGSADHDASISSGGWSSGSSSGTSPTRRRTSRSCAATSATRGVDTFDTLPGLLFTAWIADETTERWGAVYVWESRDAAEQPLPTRARELIGKDPEIAEIFDIEATVSVASELARLGLALDAE